jgi:hypothetical protein
MTVVNLLGGPLDGTVRVVPPPWPRATLTIQLDDGRQAIYQLTGSTNPTAIYCGTLSDRGEEEL